MAQADYNVHDVTVRDVPTFGLGGNVQTKTQVTFYVGTHGPFVNTYDQSEATSTKIQSDINDKVRFLRQVNGEL